MTLYRVPCRNTDTHEEIVLEIECSHPKQAQETAAISCFRELHWPRTEAGYAVEIGEETP